MFSHALAQWVSIQMNPHGIALKIFRFVQPVVRKKEKQVRVFFGMLRAKKYQNKSLG